VGGRICIVVVYGLWAIEVICVVTAAAFALQLS